MSTEVSTRRLRLNLVAAPVFAVCGVVLGVIAADEGRTLGVVVAALQVAVGLYLLVWSLRRLRHRRPQRDR